MHPDPRLPYLMALAAAPHGLERCRAAAACTPQVFNGEDWKTNTLMTAMLYPGQLVIATKGHVWKFWNAIVVP